MLRAQDPGRGVAPYDKDGNATVVRKYDGILIPLGVYYWFENTGDRNLVLLRAAGVLPGKSGDSRIDLEGRPLLAESAENKHIVGVPIPGRFFGD